MVLFFSVTGEGKCEIISKKKEKLFLSFRELFLTIFGRWFAGRYG